MKIQSTKLLIVSFLIYLVGCDSQIGIIETEQKVETIQLLKLPETILEFTSFDEYRNLVESELEKEMFMASRRQEVQTRPSGRINNLDITQEIPDGFLEYLLDGNGTVIIGDYLFKVLYQDGFVYAAKKGTQAAIEIPLGKYDNKGVMKFSTEDDVLSLIEAGHTSTPGGINAGIFCGGGCGSYDLSTPTTAFNPTGNYSYSRVRYVKAGIYFELSYHFYMHWLIPPVQFTTLNSPYSNHTAKYVKNCGSTVREDSSNGLSQMMTPQNYPSDPFTPFTFNFKRNIYSSTEGLQKIFLQVSFNSIDPSIQVTSQTINCRF
ncbi:MAG: hypothetical protein KGZ90_09305 [Algoriphagus sp.]|nr:hypothetical protein [Algoriphagus sp.]